MKKYKYHNSDLPFEADLDELKRQLAQHLQWLENYRDLGNDCEDDSAYVARGNGFCDAKYSEDFILGQIADIEKRIAQLRGWIAEQQQK